MKDINNMLKTSWEFCIRNKNSLKIPLLCDMLTDKKTADKQVSKKYEEIKPAISNVLRSLAEDKHKEVENSNGVSASNTLNETDEKLDESSYVCAVPLLTQCQTEVPSILPKKLQQKNTVTDAMRSLWPYSKTILESFLSAKQRFKQHNSCVNRLMLKSASLKVKPYFLKFVKILEEEEKAKTISKFRDRGLISMESNSEDNWKIKIINYWLNQINEFL
ncbi:hypothetical protein EB796_013247 [Bugula neritina]|nr:hypothetical protein EB796_013247 [Bugula neritina]